MTLYNLQNTDTIYFQIKMWLMNRSAQKSGKKLKHNRWQNISISNKKTSKNRNA